MSERDQPREPGSIPADSDDAQHPQSANGEFVQSLARGLAVIRAFRADAGSLSLSEVARFAEISPASARRLLHTLESLGYVRARGRQFSLTARVLELGYSYLSSLGLPELAQPHLEQLSEQLDESVSIAVLEGSQIAYVARVEARRIMRVTITVGTRFPAYATSMGQVLLAHLPPSKLAAHLPARFAALTPNTLTETEPLRARLAQVRERGWGMVDGELELGLRSLAVPIRTGSGDAVAALNISSNASRASQAQMREQYLPMALRTAKTISHELSALGGVSR